MVRTAVRRRAAVLAVLAGACGDGAGPGSLPDARIDFVAGALEPIVSPGQTVVIEGFGFGTATGTVTLRTAGGAEAPAALEAGGWSPFAVRATIPQTAAAGPLTLTTSAGRRLTAAVRVVPAAPFAPAALTWRAHGAFPRAPVGVAVAAAEFATATGWAVTVFAAGGAEPLGGDSLLDADSGAYVARVAPGGATGAFAAQADPLPAPRAFAAAVVATRHTSRSASAVLYVIGGIDTAGRARADVFAADVDSAGVRSRFIAVEPLPAPVAGANAAVRAGRIYVMGGTDAAGRPRRSVYVSRVALDGRLDGWFAQPDLASPRAYGGAVIRDRRAAVFGGLADSAGPGGELDSALARLATSDTAGLSPVSGFFTGAWAPATAPLPAGRSQFATLDLATVVLAVGGLYSGAAGGTAETLAASVAGDSLEPFTGPVGTNTIAGLGGGALVGPAGAAWRDADGTWHGVVLGGFDLVTRLRRAGVWGF